MKTFSRIMLLMAAVSFIGGCMGYHHQFILSAMAIVAAVVLAPPSKPKIVKKRYY